MDSKSFVAAVGILFSLSIGSRGAYGAPTTDPCSLFNASAGECRSRHNRRGTAAGSAEAVPMVYAEAAESCEFKNGYPHDF